MVDDETEHVVAARDSIYSLFLSYPFEDALARLSGKFWGFVEEQHGTVSGVFTDCFAGARVYWWQEGADWVFSENASECSQCGEVDWLEFAYFLMQGTTTSGRTFFEGLWKIPPATIVRMPEASLQSYARCVTFPTGSLTPEGVTRILRSHLASVSADFDNVRVLLSGGVDSLLLLAVACATGANVSAKTSTEVGRMRPHVDPDVSTAMRIAEYFGVDHEVVDVDTDEHASLEAFEEASMILPFDAPDGAVNALVWGRAEHSKTLIVSGETADALLCFGVSSPLTWRHPGNVASVLFRGLFWQRTLTAISEQRTAHIRLALGLARKLDRLLGGRLGADFDESVVRSAEAFLLGLAGTAGYLPGRRRDRQLRDCLGAGTAETAEAEVLNRQLNSDEMDWIDLGGGGLSRLLHVLKLRGYVQGRNARGNLDLGGAGGAQVMLPYDSNALFGVLMSNGWDWRRVLRGKHMLRDAVEDLLRLPRSVWNPSDPKTVGGTVRYVKTPGFGAFFRKYIGRVKVSVNEVLEGVKVAEWVDRYERGTSDVAEDQLVYRLAWGAATLSRFGGLAAPR